MPTLRFAFVHRLSETPATPDAAVLAWICFVCRGQLSRPLLQSRPLREYESSAPACVGGLEMSERMRFSSSPSLFCMCAGCSFCDCSCFFRCSGSQRKRAAATRNSRIVLGGTFFFAVHSAGARCHAFPRRAASTQPATAVFRIHATFD